jgi:hypothetical protein
MLQLPLPTVYMCVMLLFVALPLPLIPHFISMDALQLKFNIAMAMVATNMRSPTVSIHGRRGTGWNGCRVAGPTDDGHG